MAIIAEWLFTSADSLADASVVADSSGNDYDLSVVNPSGAFVQASDSRGYYLDVTVGGGTTTSRLEIPLSSGIGAALNNKSQMTIILAGGGNGGSTLSNYLLHLGSASERVFTVQNTTSGYRAVFGSNTSQYISGYGSDLTAIVIDTTAAANGDRMKTRRRTYGASSNNPGVSVGSAEVPQNWTPNISDFTDYYLTVGNSRATQNDAGDKRALLIFDSVLSDAEIDAIFDNLEISDDVSPVPAPPAPVLSSPSVSNLQPTTATANITTTVGSGTLYALYSTNATELAATIKAGVSRAVSATGARSIGLTGLPLGEAGYVHFIQTANGQNSNIVSYGFTTAAKMTQSTTATVALPAGYNMVELSGELYTRGLTQLQRTPQVGWQMIGLTSEIEWAADGSAQVKKIDAPFNVWIADDLGKLSRIVYDATGLSAAVFPAAPTFSNVSGAEPSATGSQSFVLSVPDHPAETITIQGSGVGATVRNGAGAAASSVTGVHGDTIHIDWVASEELSTPETFGVEMTGGVSAYFTVTTRAARAPVVTLQPSPLSQVAAIGSSVMLSVAGTNVASYQWQNGGVDIPGATGASLNFTVEAAETYSLRVRLTSPEGASVYSNTVQVIGSLAATKLVISYCYDNLSPGTVLANQSILGRVRTLTGETIIPETTYLTDATGKFTIVGQLGPAGTLVAFEELVGADPKDYRGFILEVEDL